MLFAFYVIVSIIALIAVTLAYRRNIQDADYAYHLMYLGNVELSSINHRIVRYLLNDIKPYIPSAMRRDLDKEVKEVYTNYSSSLKRLLSLSDEEVHALYQETYKQNVEIFGSGNEGEEAR